MTAKKASKKADKKPKKSGFYPKVKSTKKNGMGAYK